MGKRMGPRALGAFVVGLERGRKVVEAARGAGFSPGAFYRRRGRDPLFAAAWEEAVATSAGVMLIAAGNKRALQKRRTRRVRFTRERKEAFLAHFAATCDQKAAAEAANVCRSTVEKHLARDAAFAEAFQRALEVGYRLLEAELLRGQRAAQEAYRVTPDPDAAALARDFDRSMQLLNAWRRKDGRVGRRDGPSDDARRRWSFDEAVAELERKLRVYGRRVSDAGAEKDGSSPHPPTAAPRDTASPHPPTAAPRAPPSPLQGEG